MRRSARAAGVALLTTVLAVALTGCFSAPPQIISLEPNRGSTSVAADAPVRVNFDKAVVPISIAGRFKVDPALGSCDLTAAFSAPSTAACWIRWLAGNSGFELVHQGAVMLPATRYTFTLAGGFADTAGDVNGLDHHWDLTSAAAPRVATISPGDGSTGVALDAPLAVVFNTPMDAPSTAAAISLSPAVPGTRVVRNLVDHTRFVILPGQLLDPGITYTVAVGAAARGEDDQGLGAPAVARFVSGGRLGAAHVAVLAGLPGSAATEVLLPALAPATAGEPVAAPLVVRAARCATAHCGGAGLQAPLQTYSAAVLAPDSAHLALAVDNRSGPAPAGSLQVLDTTTNALLGDFAGAARASWSPDGSELAFVTGTDVEVFSVSGSLRRVATGTQLVAAPLWAGNATLVLSTAGAGGNVALVDLGLGARYDLPAAPAAAVAAAVSPAGSQLAVASGGTVVVLPVGAAGGAGQRLSGRLDPLGFAGEGTLVALSHGSDADAVVRINLAGGDRTTVPIDVGVADLSTVRVTADGRRLAFVAVDSAGVDQAYVCNADGSGVLPLTRLQLGDVQVQSVAFAS